MVPRRRRWRRGALRAALVALGLLVLVLAGGGGGEELLAAALAAWGEAWGGRGVVGGQEGGVVGAGGAGSYGGGFMNEERGERGNGAGLVTRGREIGAGLEGGGFVNGEGVGEGERGLSEGVGRGNRDPEVLKGGSGARNGGPGVLNGTSGGVNGGPGAPNRGPSAQNEGPDAPNRGPGVPSRGPAAPPGCLGLLSGGSGDLDEGAQPRPRPATPKILLAPPPCASPPPFLLVLVPSAPSHLPRRLAVRDTWGRPPPTTTSSSPPLTRTLFVMGVPPTPNSQRELLREWGLHGDLLQGDFGDSYSNLTLKTLLLLRWALSCCGGAPFVLKADDDTFVNPPAITTYLSSPATPHRLYLGRVHWRVAPNRDPRSRHHVPAWLYRDSAFPPYCSGTAYVLSRQAAAAVLAAAPRVPLVGPEDVWVGLCARRAGVAPRHSARFGGSARVPPERCCLGEVMFSAHRLRPHELRGLWGGGSGGLGGACGVVQRLLGVLRCRGLALWEWLWGR